MGDMETDEGVSRTFQMRINVDLNKSNYEETG